MYHPCKYVTCVINIACLINIDNSIETDIQQTLIFFRWNPADQRAEESLKIVSPTFNSCYNFRDFNSWNLRQTFQTAIWMKGKRINVHIFAKVSSTTELVTQEPSQEMTGVFVWCNRNAWKSVHNSIPSSLLRMENWWLRDESFHIKIYELKLSNRKARKLIATVK